MSATKLSAAEIYISAQSTETFFAEELLAVLLREGGFPWRQTLNYSVLGNRLQSISEYIIPVMNGVKVFSIYNRDFINKESDRIKGILKQFEREERFAHVLQVLVNFARVMLPHDEPEKIFFVFIGVVKEVCIWFISMDQACLIAVAATAVRTVFEFPFGFIPILQRLRNYTNEQ